jgi:hypothetical protein
MIWKRFIGGLAIASALAIGCGGGGTGPTPPPPPKLTSVSLTGNPSVTVGQTTTLTATANFSDTSTQNVTTSATWASSNANIASVSVGVVTGQAAGSANITATFQGVMSAPQAIQVTAPVPAVQADFSVTPDDPKQGNAFQCPINPAPPVNTLLCLFDSTPSIPSSGITSYRWEIPAGSANVFSGSTVKDQPVPCGSIGAGGDKTVKLTIVAPGGSSSTTKTVTFVKAKPC